MYSSLSVERKKNLKSSLRLAKNCPSITGETLKSLQQYYYGRSIVYRLSSQLIDKNTLRLNLLNKDKKTYTYEKLTLKRDHCL